MRKRFHILCGIATVAFLLAPFANAQTTVNKIVYTLNSAGTAYTVTGFEEGIVDAVIESSIDGKPVTTINQNVFKTAATLKSVMIPASVTTMGNSIFQNNKSLEIVTFEDGDQPLAMGGWTFNGCTNIKEILLPARLSAFGNTSNFNGCTSLSKVTFGEGCKLSDLKQSTFTGCTALEEIDLSPLKSIKTLPASIFKNSGLKRIRFAEDAILGNIQWDVFLNTPLESVELPASLRSIGARAFQNCSKLLMLEIPAYVKSIAPDAFGNTNGNTGVNCVVFNQHGGTWPSVDSQGNADLTVSILGANTKAYCYKDVENAPENVITVAPIYAEKYTTYFNSRCAIELPEGVCASTVSTINNSNLVLDFSKYTAGSTIPGQTPVLLQCEQENTTLYPRILPSGPVVPISPNLLVGNENDAAYQKSTINYVLTETAGSYSFDKVETGTNPANHAYLALSESLADGKNRFPLDDIASGMPSVIMDNDAAGKIFNLMGIEMDPENLCPGIYIKNGKKFIIRK